MTQDPKSSASNDNEIEEQNAKAAEAVIEPVKMVDAFPPELLGHMGRVITLNEDA